MVQEAQSEHSDKLALNKVVSRPSCASGRSCVPLSPPPPGGCFFFFFPTFTKVIRETGISWFSSAFL